MWRITRDCCSCCPGSRKPSGAGRSCCFKSGEHALNAQVNNQQLFILSSIRIIWSSYRLQTRVRIGFFDCDRFTVIFLGQMSRKKAARGKAASSSPSSGSPAGRSSGRAARSSPGIVPMNGVVHPSRPSISSSSEFYDIAFKVRRGFQSRRDNGTSFFVTPYGHFTT